ncbi:hypothetical protein U9R90_25040 [Streptomyces sp. E11-3]|uniref:hypothetical protein n=1 Tax=Streptomyces sp. E11-3 TaxID=3110112 RepID=UPI00397F1F51
MANRIIASNGPAEDPDETARVRLLQAEAAADYAEAQERRAAQDSRDDAFLIARAAEDAGGAR